MLRITKESIFCEHYIDDSIQTHDVIEDGCFPNHLQDEIYIEKDVTLKDLLEHLEKRSESVETVFGSALGGLPLEPFLEEMRLSDKSNKNLKHLVFGRTCEIVEYQDGSTELIEATELYTIGEDSQGQEKEFMLEFSPVSYYSDVPIVLDETYQIWQYIPTTTYIKESDGSLKRVFDKRSILKTVKTFTLFEFLHTVLYEISKYGTPSERDEVKTSLYGESAVEQEKSATQSEAGILQRIQELERLEKDAVEKEEYEKSANYRDKILELKEKMKRQENE